MTCHHRCGEKTTLLDRARLFAQLLVPWRVYAWLEARRERKNVEFLMSCEVPYLVRDQLTNRELEICCSLIAGQSYEVIAKRLNVTRERVRQIARKAITKLKGEIRES